MGNIEHDAGHRGAKGVEDRIESVDAEIVDPIECRGRRQQAEMVGAFGQQAVDERGVDTIGREYRIRDPLRGILIVVETGGAERQVEIGGPRIHRALPRDRPGDAAGVEWRSVGGASRLIRSLRGSWSGGRFSPADCTAAAVSTVSQKACTDTRGAGAM